jgi:Zn-finger nucleic acid-binding protein
MLCIVNPQATASDETEGYWADLLSTHPPLSKRMDILLAMARVNIADLAAGSDRMVDTKNRATAGPQFFAMNPQQQWQGPFSPAELAVLPWLSPLTWVLQGSGAPVERAWKDPLVNALFLEKFSRQKGPSSELSCPSCHQMLVSASYEGTLIDQCRFCSGVLVGTEKIPRIIARTGMEQPCSERVTALAKSVVKQNLLRFPHRADKVAGAAAIPLLACPKCRNPMSRGFYSQAHLIEIDRCGFCGLTWFDQDELAMLQCLIENRILPEIDERTASIQI